MKESEYLKRRKGLVRAYKLAVREAAFKGRQLWDFIASGPVDADALDRRVAELTAAAAEVERIRYEIVALYSDFDKCPAAGCNCNTDEGE